MIKAFFEKNKRSKKAESVLKTLSEKYTFIDCGSNRAVFQLKKHVLKFPINDEGEHDNIHEAKHANINELTNEYQIQTPRARHIIYNGFDCLIMEYVKEADWIKLKKEMGRLPQWMYGLDCMQIGYTKEGRLVAYDYGIF